MTLGCFELPRDAALAIYRIALNTWAAWRPPPGTAGSFKSRLTASLTSPTGLRDVFAVFRCLLPNLVIRKSFVKAYDNTGTALITRSVDVQEVLRRDGDFEVVYAPRMQTITAGANFFLGMANTPEYTRDVANMRLAVRREDIATLIVPFATRRAAEIVAAASVTNAIATLDVPAALTLPVAAQLTAHYFGTPGTSEADLIEQTTTLFWYLFIDLAADPELDARSKQNAAALRARLDAVIAARKAAPTASEDVLARCLAMQAAGLPGMDDLGIRNYLIGLIIGAIPTTSRAAVQALDQLLERPEALTGAQSAARANDDALLAGHVFEALRFNPINPVIYRRAVSDTVIAEGTLRARKIRAGTMVMAANLSAMFDPLHVAAPTVFRSLRPADDYILWGQALHKCFGAYINAALIPALLKPLLVQKNLRRTAGQAGHIETSGTPFPTHFEVEFDAP